MSTNTTEAQSLDNVIPMAERVPLSERVLAKVGEDGSFTEAGKVELRLVAMEMAIEIATAKGKPGHAPYIAGDIYSFLLTGERPKVPDFVTNRQAQAEEPQPQGKKGRR